MPRSRRWSDERGSASLEFLVAGFVLLIPVVYLMIAMSSIQSASLAVEGAARQAARVFVQSPDEAAGRDAVARAVEFALVDHGVDPATASVSITCGNDPCLTRRGAVTVSVEYAASLPLMPPVIAGMPLSVPLDASATQRVSRFWNDG
jgi:Flp pilus assembly protein TadG